MRQTDAMLHKEAPTSGPAAHAPQYEAAQSPAGGAEDRFMQLLGRDAWQRLPAAVRRRFSKRLTGNDSHVYQGNVRCTKLNTAGRLLATVTRLIGSPLPRDATEQGPAVVIVTQNGRSLSQNWVRTYPRAKGGVHVITSEKRFQGPTGLEEYVGYGIGMTLKVIESKGALVFHSDRYFFEWRRCRIYLPRVLSPGEMKIVHRDEGAGRFCFELSLSHALFGLMVYQAAAFYDAPGARLNGAENAISASQSS